FRFSSKATAAPEISTLSLHDALPISPEALDDPAAPAKFLSAAAYDDQRTLSQVLPPRLREKLRRLLARQGGSIARVDGYEPWFRSEEHTSELQSRENLVCRLLLEKKK